MLVTSRSGRLWGKVRVTHSPRPGTPLWLVSLAFYVRKVLGELRSRDVL